MGFVEWLLTQTEAFLNATASSQFGAMAAALGTIFILLATVLIVVVLINFVLQVRSMDGRTAVLLLVKLSLINIFAFNWTQFNLVTNAVIDGLNRIAASLIAAVSGESPGGGGFMSFAQSFDGIIAEFSNYLNAATSNMGWMTGAMVGGLGAGMLGLLAALCAGILIFTKIMLSFMFAIAPIMLIASMFEVTKDYFHRWLTNTVSYALYPVVIAGIFSTIIGLTTNLAAVLGDPEDATSMGQLIPFFAMILLSMGLMAVTPILVSSLSGNLAMASASALAGQGIMLGSMARAGASAAALTALRFGRGAANTQVHQAQAARGVAPAAAVAGRIAGSTAQKAGQAINRMVTRNRTLSK